MFTFLVDVAVHGFHLSCLLRGGLLCRCSNPKTTPVGCVPSSPFYPTHTHTHKENAMLTLLSLARQKTSVYKSFNGGVFSFISCSSFGIVLTPYLLMPLTSSEAHGWCMLRHQPPSDISCSSLSWSRNLERSSTPLSSTEFFACCTFLLWLPLPPISTH